MDVGVTDSGCNNAHQNLIDTWILQVQLLNLWMSLAFSRYRSRNPHCRSTPGTEESRSWLAMSLILAPTHDERLVVEPQPAVFLQNRLCRGQIVTGLHDRIEPLILDLIDVNCGIPGCEQR
jgi:hypothetical protein